MRTALLLTLLALAPAAAAQHTPDAAAITGRWTTIDDNTGKPRSVVEITLRNGRAYGRIVDLYDKTKLHKLCDRCPGDRKDRRIVGLEIIRDMVADGEVWEDGTILDPENGKVYTCKLWAEDGMLKVRGYIAFLYRTQTWVRVPGP
ncbi:MAG: DUF2147 domain-containing protein [Flavobacteriales bacterium]|nr:hypothetical protein [Flavobacteriales bacterium]MCC6576292.1 DUF2147 domain-containing protein [Flavobacteriales bacterium]NUQ15273.1 DUF2147 domain-containing protein [Flavobacteriales bacterium]